MFAQTFLITQTWIHFRQFHWTMDFVKHVRRTSSSRLKRAFKYPPMWASKFFGCSFTSDPQIVTVWKTVASTHFVINAYIRHLIYREGNNLLIIVAIYKLNKRIRMSWKKIITTKIYHLVFTKPALKKMTMKRHTNICVTWRS